MHFRMLLAAVAVVLLALTAFAEEPGTEKGKWDEHMGDLPFVIGYEKGMKEVELTGRPPMYFFTTTW